MAQAATTPTTTRRALLAGAGAVLALPASAAIAAGDDATLIDLGRQLMAAWAIERDLCAKHAGDVEVNAAVERCSGIVSAIEAAHATTLAGVRVKAMGIFWCWDGQFIERDTTDLNVATSMVRDLLAMEGA